MNSVGCSNRLRIGDWCADRASGELSGHAGTFKTEPKVMDLLFLLASHPGQVVARERIMLALWPGVVVGDDSLARTVSKLRQVLGDDARAPRYVETISKRGYRLLANVQAIDPSATTQVDDAGIAPVTPHKRWHWRGPLFVAGVLVAIMVAAWFSWPQPIITPAPNPDGGALMARADDAYFQFSRADNEAAIELYQRVLGLYPDDAAAMAGLANALTQRALRWPQATEHGHAEFSQLGAALANGHLQREPQRAQLGRARQLAERATTLAPDSAAAHKALGFVASAQTRFDAALASYRTAVSLDPDAWGALINIGDVLEITGHRDEAVHYFELAHAAMERSYDRTPAQIRPWQSALGVLIASRHHTRGDRAAAEAWYRRVLMHAPLDASATRGLATVLREGGDRQQAERLCTELRQRLGPGADCD